MLSSFLVLVLVIFKVHDCDQGFCRHGSLNRGPHAPAGLVPLFAGVVSAPCSGVPTACTLTRSLNINIRSATHKEMIAGVFAMKQVASTAFWECHVYSENVTLGIGSYSIEFGWCQATAEKISENSSNESNLHGYLWEIRSDKISWEFKLPLKSIVNALIKCIIT
jgi:hypothetical protein